MPRFGFRGFPRPEEEDPFFGGQDPEMIPPWEREPEIRSFSPEEAELPSPELLESLVSNFQQPEKEEMGTPVFDRYLEEIQNAPRREDYEVGTGKKILAGLAGAATGFTSGASAGSKVIQDITEGPYAKAQKDFKDRIEPLEKGVGFEKSFSETLRKRQNDQGNRGFKLAELQAKKTKIDNDLEIAFQKADNEVDKTRILRIRAEADADYKLEEAKIHRMNADSNRIKADATQTRAEAYAKNPSVTGQGRTSSSKVIKSNNLSKERAFQEAQKIHPTIEATFDPVTNIVNFGKGVSDEDQQRFMENYEANKPLIENELRNKGRR